jgi:hypothetical protein
VICSVVGSVTTVAGTWEHGLEDGRSAVEAQFAWPDGICFGSVGAGEAETLIISQEHCIRQLTLGPPGQKEKQTKKTEKEEDVTKKEENKNNHSKERLEGEGEG